MPKVRLHNQQEEFERKQKRQRRWIGWFLLICALVVLFVTIGYNAHPTCTQNCQNRPVYFYGIRMPGTNYSEFYGTDDNGNASHNAANGDDENNSSHSSSGSSDDEGGGFHSEGGFHGGEP